MDADLDDLLGAEPKAHRDEQPIPEDGAPVHEEEPIPLPPEAIPLEAVRLFVLHGSLAEVSRQLNIPIKELTRMSKTAWWHDEVLDLRRARNAILDAQLTRLHETTIEEMIDRVENGEKTVSKTTGKVARTPMKARDLAALGHTIFMERQLLRNEPTTVAGETNKVTVLAEKLRALGIALGAPDKAIVVEVEDATPTTE